MRQTATAETRKLPQKDRIRIYKSKMPAALARIARGMPVRTACRKEGIAYDYYKTHIHDFEKKPRSTWNCTLTYKQIHLLEYALSRACNKAEAAAFAQIEASRLSKETRESPWLRRKLDKACKKTTIAAQFVIADSILEDGNLHTSKWYLERRKPKEYGLNNRDAGPSDFNIEDWAMKAEKFLEKSGCADKKVMNRESLKKQN